jgi:SAM-dependent methyltransferase
MSDKLRLFLLSALMLFVELALIRWSGENVVYLSFFSNFVLLGSFLGIGIGFLWAGRRPPIFRYAPLLLAVYAAFVAFFPAKVDRTGAGLIYFGEYESVGLPPWVMLPLIFLAVAAIMATVADGVARTFARFEALQAYRFDILGSIAGTVAFAALSFLRAPPLVWGVVVAGLLLLLAGQGVLQWVPVAAVVIVLAWQSFLPGLSWSPYYQVETKESTLEDGSPWIRINVNGIPHQAASTIEARREIEPLYFRPYELLAPDHPLDRVLIVGAGSGTDVALALAEGAGTVDAVEIDPEIFRIGEEKHPDRPYDDPRVNVHIDDGRAFMERSSGDYDLIIFALPDSLTLVSGQSALRLESFLFTKEAIAQARDLLAPGGVFTMYNYYREPWLIDRLAATLEESFGTAPCVEAIFRAGGLATLMVSPDPEAVRCPSGELAQGLEDAPPPVDDNRPFLYLREPGLPGLYLLAIALILVASAIAVRAVGGPLRGMAAYLDLFFMGAAFLLLETKNVVQFALLFGTTWLVNALVFIGILLTVYLAVEVARLRRLPRAAVLYVLLFATLAIAWVVPPASLLELPVGLRWVSATLLAFAPVFVANLVFAQRFKDTASSTTAFGANLLGAMVGGVIEYLALVMGYRSLLVVAAALYACAFLAGRRHLARRSAPAVTAGP